MAKNLPEVYLTGATKRQLNRLLETIEFRMDNLAIPPRDRSIIHMGRSNPKVRPEALKLLLFWLEKAPEVATEIEDHGLNYLKF